MHYSTVHDSTVHYSTVHDSTVNYSTVHHSTVHYSTMHYSIKRKKLKKINPASWKAFCHLIQFSTLVLFLNPIDYLDLPSTHPAWEIYDNTQLHQEGQPINPVPTLHIRGTSDPLHRHWVPPIHPAGRVSIKVRQIILLSNKDRNARIKSYNGNRMNLINIAHWNAGNSKWETKRIEIEALVLQKQPDLLFVSEANLWDNLDSSQIDIPGYNLHYPRAMMSKHNYARIVLLAKSELDIKIEDNLMHEDISAIWLSLSYAGNRKMKIGGIYREHRLLFQPDPNPTKTDASQLTRWNTILDGWKAAAQDPSAQS